MRQAVTAFETPPASPAGFRAVWARLGAPRRIVLAVSGGGDSMALMHLAAPLQHAGQAEVLAATVDHGLRLQSRAEAELVAAVAADLSLSHVILQWTGEKPQTAVQAAARRARYRLLVGYAHSVAADAIMTGHTADDQAETVLLRAARSSGPRGLAGIEEASLIAAGVSPAIRLLRPVLDIRRAALRVFLAGAGIAFVEDPSNLDRRFERVRIRHDLAARQATGTASVEAIIAEARRNRIVAQREFEKGQQRFVALQGAFDAHGAASLDAFGLALEDAPLLANIVRAVAGSDHRPPSAGVERAIAAIRSRARATLGGCLLHVHRKRLIVCREPAAVLGRSGVAPLAPLPIEPGAKALWDRRFIVSNSLGAPALLRPLGEDAARIADDPTAALALSSCPGIWAGGALAAFPGENEDFRPLATEKFHLRVNRFH